MLPFRNLSADPENEYFADGITEDVIAQLSKVRALKVISSGSVMRFKNREQSLQEIGAALDVSTVLEGSVRRAGSRVRIVAELIDAETNRQLWAETYDRELTDIFAIQSDVALQIAGRLETELSPEERSRIRQAPTDDIQAYQSYLLGKHCVSRWTQEGVDQGLKHLEDAVARDPNFALAYSVMAYTYTSIGLGVAGSLPAAEAFGRAKTAVTRALGDRQRAVGGTFRAGLSQVWRGVRLGRGGTRAEARDRAQPEQRGSPRPLRAHAVGARAL